jgi:DNA-binding SARP family transcriptional activator/tetratricopeptide (TPR) repeat protein
VLIRLLGPVDVLADDGPREIRGLRRKAVLAALALHGCETVSAGRLAEIAWGKQPPPTVENSLQAHVSHLRAVLGSKTAIRACRPGYSLDIGGEPSDAQVAERLLREGTSATDPVRGAARLGTALALWRGRSLADMTGLAWLEEQAVRLDLLCLQVRRALADARLAAGEHAALVPELEEMAADSPLDEQVHGQLMLALYRCGRQADALAAFSRLRAELADQLGIDPSSMLRDLEVAILRQDEALAVPGRPRAVLAPRPGPAPAQLPVAVPGFAGRAAELASMDAALARADAEHNAGSATMVISAVSGTAGVGKTALAVQWAHQVAARFPDGQLYVNLRGFGPAGQPVEPGEAVRGFLAGLGVTPAQLPGDGLAQAAMYRSLLADRRVLIVLDNARDAAQVRPLLPASPGCAAIVTSRSDLAGLVAAEGACPVRLDLLTPAGAGELLARRLGEARVAAEPAAVARIIERCARLPLALAITAARAALRPNFPLAAIAAGLEGAATTLDAFGGTDLATDVRAVFSWSFRLLSDDAARLFALLGLHPGPDISVGAAASLAAIPPGRAAAQLAELADAHLISEHRPGRYAAHDLLRAYAAEQVHSLVPEPARAAASQRILDHYLHTAYAAARLLKPERDDPNDLGEPAPGTTAEELTSQGDARAWFTAEHHVLMACISTSAAAGLDRLTWQLAWTLKTYLFRGGHWHDQVAAERAAADAARRSGDLSGLGIALSGQAEAEIRLNRLDEAGSHFREARASYSAAGDLVGEADVYLGMSALATEQHRNADALGHSRRALDAFRRAGNGIGQVIALNSIGWDRATLGEYHQALTSCREALALVQELGFSGGAEATIWDSLGHAHHGLAEHGQAARCYQRALGLYRGVGDRYNEAGMLASLGDVHLSAGDSGAARRAWAKALRILEEIGHADASSVRAKLTSHANPGVLPARR